MNSASSSSMSLTTYLTRTLPLRRRSPIAISSSTATVLLSTAWSILRAPSSRRLAIASSPSRVSSETEPILRRYMRTGSLVREYAYSSSSSTSPSSFAFSMSRPLGGSTSASRRGPAPSTTSMPWSPSADSHESIWSVDTASSGIASLTSSYVTTPFCLPSSTSLSLALVAPFAAPAPRPFLPLPRDSAASAAASASLEELRRGASPRSSSSSNSSASPVTASSSTSTRSSG